MSSSTSHHHHHLLLNPPPRSLFISATKTPNLLSLPTTTRPHFPISTSHSPPNPTHLASLRHRLNASSSSAAAGPPSSSAAEEFSFNLDYFLSVAELLCLASSAVVSIGYGLSSAVPGWKNAAFIGGTALGGGAAALVMAVGIGAWIRRRQWRRVSRETVKGGLEVNLFERIEKLEEDLRSSVTIVRVLSRQLEKLGIRFRVTRKALKEPIAETAALAQKNSEATRALAAQEDILEKELGETQKVLLALQEQQQKQFDLILAIAKSGKLLDNKHAHDQPESTIRTHDSSTDNSKQKEPQQI
ncbi:PREDICTED: uncharacterized protein LOC101314793 [Fragaria vesca subsp. vesca]|uniref:uncharacterized protein LOC101314793 n=1 Tax=Fragaria vesca subsp. vesca TaxID=101020 RepID=UPI0002C3342A|nr:PREDICTED: uncharacterized protein LOC101314793 [Fragaria vesca subsp. vesca]